MCRQKRCFQTGVEIECMQLRWLHDDPHGELDGLISGGKSRFDRVIAADCMFFEDFHDDLVWVLLNALSDDGVVYMLQPRRGRTMETFLDKAQSHFHIIVSESYDKKVITSQLHNKIDYKCGYSWT